MRGGETWGGFVETTAFGGFKMRMAMRNADTRRRERNRAFFAPDRSGAWVGTERRFTGLPAFVTLTFSGSF